MKILNKLGKADGFHIIFTRVQNHLESSDIYIVFKAFCENRAEIS